MPIFPSLNLRSFCKKIDFSAKRQAVRPGGGEAERDRTYACRMEKQVFTSHMIIGFKDHMEG